MVFSSLKTKYVLQSSSLDRCVQEVMTQYRRRHLFRLLTLIAFVVLFLTALRRLVNPTSMGRANVGLSFHEREVIKTRMQQRRKTTRVVCKKYGMRWPRPFKMSASDKSLWEKTMLISNKIKVIFCPIPKCGTRNQAKFLAAMEGRLRESMSDVEVKSFAKFAFSGKKINEDMMETYAKAIVVREPFARLVSAFRDKLESNTRGDGYSKLARKISGNQAGSRSLRPDFGQFVRYLTNSSDKYRFYPHWKFYHSLCSPCKIGYDYILHVETFEEDMKFLLGELGVTGISFPPPYTFRTNETTVKEYFSRVPKELAKSLYEKYKRDYELFGYQRPTFLDDT